jgi:hypothetical protein
MTAQPKVHIQDPTFKSRALCGQPWSRVKKGGEPRSDTDPPAVFVIETGSVHPASCQQCCLAWRKSRFTPAP